ncbi:MAG: crotonobetainyl-CoA:carnitine CoA-transferase CaiB-like acyl-CoA transferase [Planctomycetota bacterium]|jgi:crotonobetainyl-CoA:carnitine CoA-transferase CaiB-like acyl-CoA transferase
MSPVPSTDQPLEGYVVLDLSRILAGPYCTMMLGDQGADVIKVEQPGVGDDTRTWGPPFVGGESAYYLSCNRNKRSIAIDLKSEQGIATVLELVARAHVLVHNFTPGLMEKFGLGYDVLHELNPGLVYASISAYGQDGPYRDRPGYDMVLSAVGGMMHITGERDGAACKVGVAITDVMSGVHAAGAITSALLYKARTGRGQHLDISLLDVQVSALANVASSFLVAGQEATRWGTAHASIVPYQVFPTQDRPIAIAAANQKLWGKLCRVLGHDEWHGDERFASNALRVVNREVLLAKIEAVLAGNTCDAWMALMVEAGVPAGPVNDMQHLFDDAQVRHRGLVQSVEHPTVDNLRLVGPAVQFSESPMQIFRHPPLLGEHTEQVLAEILGYSSEKIEELRALWS